MNVRVPLDMAVIPTLYVPIPKVPMSVAASVVFKEMVETVQVIKNHAIFVVHASDLVVILILIFFLH